MALLTAAAITGFREYVKRTVVKAKYRIGGTLYDAQLNDIVVDGSGIVRISFMINPPTAGNVTITEVQLYDNAGQLWLSKAVSLDMSAVAEGYYYLVKLQIKETEMT